MGAGGVFSVASSLMASPWRSRYVAYSTFMFGMTLSDGGWSVRGRVYLLSPSLSAALFAVLGSDRFNRFEVFVGGLVAAFVGLAVSGLT